eukprot:scaffold15104_cov59-Phaeocystis_antarctica.AAC.2
MARPPDSMSCSKCCSACRVESCRVLNTVHAVAHSPDSQMSRSVSPPTSANTKAVLYGFSSSVDGRRRGRGRRQTDRQTDNLVERHTRFPACLSLAVTHETVMI